MFPRNVAAGIPVLRSLGVILRCGALKLVGAELNFDPSVIEQATGLKGTSMEAEGVFTVSSPRKDLPVTIDGWKIPAFMGLTSWGAFTGGGQAEAMIAGDLALFEDEVNPVMGSRPAAQLAAAGKHALATEKK